VKRYFLYVFKLIKEDYILFIICLFTLPTSFLFYHEFYDLKLQGLEIVRLLISFISLLPTIMLFGIPLVDFIFERKPNIINGKIFSHIYVIKTADTNYPVYIGQTLSLEERRSGHTRKYPRNRYYMELIERCLLDEVDDLEKYYIKKYRSLGYNLDNETEGGSNVGARSNFNPEKYIEYED